MKNALMIYDFRSGKMNEFYLYKDQVMISYFLGKEYNIKTNFLFIADDFTDFFLSKNVSFRGLEIIAIRKSFQRISDIFIFLKNIKVYLYLYKNSKRIEYLYLYHVTFFNYVYVLIYKFRNKKGKIYLKADANLKHLKKIKEMKNGNLLQRVRSILIKKLVEKVDLISFETKECYKEAGILFSDNKKKISYIPNCFDETIIKNFRVKDSSEKEKIILTVGRLDDKNKNFSMMLDAVEKIDLKDWKFYFIGPASGEIEKRIVNFHIKYPEKRENIFFMGSVTDKKELFEYYNRAKVFTLSSISEGFPLVFVEAMYFGNYIFTTNFGGAAWDVTANGELGTVVDVDLESYLKGLNKIVNGEIDFELKYKDIRKYLKENFLWNNIVKKNICFKEFF